MIYISSTEIESLTEEKLKAFLTKKYRENRFLDYKLKYEKKSKDQTKEEFLADVTGFANYYGGNIIIGVEELEEEGVSAQPGKLIGVDNGDKLAEAFRNLCDTCIDPPIYGLVIKERYLKNGRWAIVIYVPVSLRRPHMVTFKGRNRFYIRRDDRTVKMATDEVKRIVLEVISIEKNIDDYIRMIEEEVIKDAIGGHFSLVMHAIPYLLEEDQIDTSLDSTKAILQDGSLTHGHNSIVSINMPAPILYGIEGGESYDNPLYHTYIHRNGYLGLIFDIKEFNVALDKDRKILAPWINDYLVLFLKLCKLTTEKAMISSPYQLRCNFENADGSTFPEKRSPYSSRRKEIVCKRQRLRLPGIRVDSFEKSAEVAELFYKRLRNAFALE